jgi:hypothetical protein
VAEFMQGLDKFDLEHIGYFDPQGKKIADAIGTRTSTSIRLLPEEVQRIVGGYMIHNHPKPLPDDPMSHTYQESFSPVDVTSAITRNVAETRVVGWEHTYYLRRPANGQWANVPQDAIDLVRKRHKALSDALKYQMQTGLMSLAEVHHDYAHTLWQDVAQELGATYWRTSNRTGERVD